MSELEDPTTPVPFHTEEGEAKDQETIIRLRPQIEEIVGADIGGYARTELIWNMNDNEDTEDFSFWYKILFFKE